MTWILTGLFTFATVLAVYLLYAAGLYLMRTRSEREPDIDWTQLEGDLSEYVRRRNGEAM
jgi:hypothetical protein